MANFGLIGKSLKHSFSKQYFTHFFRKENLPHSYSNFEMEDLSGLKDLIKEKDISGLNVTIPFKEDVIPYLDEMDEAANVVGAVNVIKISNGKLKGYNTDVIGFWQSLQPFLINVKPKAMILGTGGASKAVQWALEKNEIHLTLVTRNSQHATRNPQHATINYQQLTEQLVSDHKLIINCTPLGMFPHINEKPLLPYSAIGNEHILFDLIYNPTETEFLKEGRIRGASIKNGEEMLRIQAEESWQIWNA